ncbi:MAG: Trm112 family protein [Candidatus Heimdallarchaeaceae archaeon]
MKHRLLDLLACPVEKGWPLKLKIQNEEPEEEELDIPVVCDETQVVCKYYCNFKNYLLVVDSGSEERFKPIDEIKKHVTVEDCKNCFQVDITQGLLYCPVDEEHVYKIKDGIPIMLTKEQIDEIYGGKIE